MAACRIARCQTETLPEKMDPEPNSKKKIIQTFFILMIYCLLGIIRGQEGLTFLDLITLTNSDITKGSLIFTVSSLGFVIGVLFIGVLYDKLNNDLLHGSCVLMVGIATVLIPWCDSLALMVTLCGLRALFQGPADSGSTVICAKIWLLKAGPILHGLQFLFAMGGIVSPFVTEPFLRQSNDSVVEAAGVNHVNFRNAAAVVYIDEVNTFPPESDYDFVSTTESNTSNGPAIMESARNFYQTNLSKLYTNESGLNSTSWASDETSSVYIAFTISGSLLVAIALAFFLKTLVYSSGDFDRFHRINRTDGQKLEGVSPLDTFPILVKIMCYILLAVNCFAHGCVEKIYMMYLMTFVVEYLGWNKLDGSIATSVFWAGFAAGRLSAVIITNFLRPRTIMVLSLLGLIIIQGCMLAVEYFTLSEEFWWVLVGASGLFIGPLFASTVSWVGLNLTPVRGKIMSFIFVWMFVGSMTHLYLLGYLFEHSSPIWFVYLLLVYTILALAAFLGLHFVVINQPKVCNTQEEVTASLTGTKDTQNLADSKTLVNDFHDDHEKLPISKDQNIENILLVKKI